MGFSLFKKKNEDIPDDIGFETPPTLANPMGTQNNNMQQMGNMPTNNIQPMGIQNNQFSNTPNLPPIPQPQQQIPQMPTQYHPPYQPQQNYNPDIESQVKLLQTKVESITVQLNTISQKLDYIINVLRSQGYKF